MWEKHKTTQKNWTNTSLCVQLARLLQIISVFLEIFLNLALEMVMSEMLNLAKQHKHDQWAQNSLF